MMKGKFITALIVCYLVLAPVCGYSLGKEGVSGIDTSYFVSGDNDLNLATSAKKGNLAAVKLLVERGVNVDAMLEDGITPLINAAQAGNSEICSYLIEHGARVDLKPASGRTALFAAVKSGKVKTAELLIQKGATIDEKDFFDRTPLMYAASFNDTAMCNLFIAHNANLNITDNDGSNALMAAVIHNRFEAAAFLLQKGMSADTKDMNGVTPLMIASGNGNTKLAELLLNNNANINSKTKSGETALTIAIMKSDEQMVNLLIEHKADVNQKLKAAETPLTIARFYKVNKSVIDLLVLSDAKENHLPDIRMLTIGPEFNFNWTDYMNGLSIGLKEIKYQIDLDASFHFRIVPNRISIHNSDSYYQFWEKRSIVSLGVNKNFNISQTSNFNTMGVSIGLRGAYTYGGYRGTDIPAREMFFLIPEIGVYQIFKEFQIGLKYNYTDLKTLKINPSRLTVSFKVMFGSFTSYDSFNYEKWQY